MSVASNETMNERTFEFQIDRSRLRDQDEGTTNLQEIQSSPEFQSLRRSLLGFIFPVTALFLAWYMAYVVLSAYFHDLMSYKIAGEINLGMALGLLQFVTTMLIVYWYIRYAERSIDPKVEEMADRVGDRL